MALFIPGKSVCVLCGQPILKREEVACFPAFLPNEHRFHNFSDSVFHEKCYETWPNREEFDQLYRRFREAWENRPKNLKSLEEIEEWGKQAFKDLWG